MRVPALDSSHIDIIKKERENLTHTIPKSAVLCFTVDHHQLHHFNSQPHTQKKSLVSLFSNLILVLLTTFT